MPAWCHSTQGAGYVVAMDGGKEEPRFGFPRRLAMSQRKDSRRDWQGYRRIRPAGSDCQAVSSPDLPACPQRVGGRGHRASRFPRCKLSIDEADTFLHHGLCPIVGFYIARFWLAV